MWDEEKENKPLGVLLSGMAAALEGVRPWSPARTLFPMGQKLPYCHPSMFFHDHQMSGAGTASKGNWRGAWTIPTPWHEMSPAEMSEKCRLKCQVSFISSPTLIHAKTYMHKQPHRCLTSVKPVAYDQSKDTHEKSSGSMQQLQGQVAVILSGRGIS